MLHHVDREILLAHRVQGRNQRDQQGGVADGEDAAPRAGVRVSPPPFRQAAVTDDVRQPDSDQREEE
jgi:hypothetical protein